VAPKALSSCEKCHALGPIAPQSSAPSLWQIWGRKIAADGGFEYSDSLAGRSGVWDEQALRAYLSDGEGFAPDGSMPDQALSGAELDAVIEELERLQ